MKSSSWNRYLWNVIGNGVIVTGQSSYSILVKEKCQLIFKEWKRQNMGQVHTDKKIWAEKHLKMVNVSLKLKANSASKRRNEECGNVEMLGF